MPAEQVKNRSKWRNLRQVRKATIPAKASQHLLDHTSLTTKVKAYVEKRKGHFSVAVINEADQKPSINEQAYLGMRQGLYARIREIYLMCDDEKIIYARSVIPISTMTGRQRQIKHLKNRSLGAYLFSDRTLHREITQLAKSELNGHTVWVVVQCLKLITSP